MVHPDEIVIRGPDQALAETAFGAIKSEDFPLPAVQISDHAWRTGQDSNPKCPSLLRGCGEGAAKYAFVDPSTVARVSRACAACASQSET